jgi:hypothetical protein
VPAVLAVHLAERAAEADQAGSDQDGVDHAVRLDVHGGDERAVVASTAAKLLTDWPSTVSNCLR